MFYFDKINGKRVLKSDLIKSAEAFFTTRDICLCDKRINNQTEQQIQNNKISAEINANKKIILNYLQIDGKNFVSPEQTHSANIETAKETKKNYPNCDALILTDKNLGIFLNFADCTPIILYDEKQNIGAIAHAGWRGTAQKIAAKTVQMMVESYNSKPKDIQAVIGPTIGFCCYNVGEEVYEKLSKTVSNFDGLFKIDISADNLYTKKEQIFVDLKNINKRQLEESGVKKFDICPYCTVHNNDIFFSYRNENGTARRHSAVLKII